MARSKGSGTLIKRGKIYLAKWVVDGKIFTRSTQCTTKEEALKKLKEYTHPFQIESNVEKIENLEAKIKAESAKVQLIDDDFSQCPISEILDRYQKLANAKKITDSTYILYKSYVRNFTKYLEANEKNIKVVKDVNRNIIERYLASIKNIFASSRYNCIIALFKRIWTEFSKISPHRCFKNNPWNDFKYKPADVSLKRELTVEELVKVISLTTDKDLNLLLCIGFYTGLRLGDCCNLKWENIDFIRNQIIIIPRKTKKSRKSVTVPIHPVLMNKLIEFKKELEQKIADGTVHTGDEIYVSYNLFKWNISGIIHIKINKIFRSAGIKTSIIEDGKKRSLVSFHSLRHTFVSMSANMGIPLDVVKNLVGHTTSKMTEHYEHISSINAQNAIFKLPNLEQNNSIEEMEVVHIKKNIIEKVSSTGKTIEEILLNYLEKNNEVIDV